MQTWKKRSRDCQTTPQSTEVAATQTTPQTRFQANQTSPATESEATKTAFATTTEAVTSAPDPSLLLPAPSVEWKKQFARSVTLTRKELLTLLNSIVTLTRAYDNETYNEDLEFPLRTVFLETLRAARRFRIAVYPKGSLKKVPARDALWP